MKCYQVTSGLSVLVAVTLMDVVSEILGVDFVPLSNFKSLCSPCVGPFNDADAFLRSSWKFEHVNYALTKVEPESKQ